MQSNKWNKIKMMKIQNTIYLSNFNYNYYFEIYYHWNILSLKYIINETQKEQDVRNLKYCLKTIYTKLNLFVS